MARKRMIDPGIWTSEDFGTLSDLAQIYFIGCISQADDDGRLKVSPGFLRVSIRPYSNDSDKTIRAALTELGNRDMVRFYSDGNGGEYGFLPTWEVYQKISKRFTSKLPDPNGYETNTEPVTNQSDTSNDMNRIEVQENRSTSTSDKETRLSDIHSIFEHYKATISPKARLTEQAKTKIRSRLEDFEVDLLKEAIDRFVVGEDGWWMDNNSHRGLKWFFGSEDRIAGFLELSGATEEPTRTSQLKEL